MIATVLPYAQTLLAVFGPVAFAYAVAYLRKRGIKTAVLEAAGGAAGTAYLNLIQSGKPLSDPVALAAALQVGKAYMLDRVPDALKSMGMSPEDAAQIAASRLGKLLAADPTVSVSK